MNKKYNIKKEDENKNNHEGNYSCSEYIALYF